MLSSRCKQLFIWSILALLMVTVVPLSAEASDSSNYGTSNLILGSSGSAVSQLQTDLTTLGFYSNSIDGSFGTKTYNAVVNFQKSKGLKTDGVVGPITKAALTAALAANGSSSSGSTGSSGTNTGTSTSTSTYTSTDSGYNKDEKPIVDSFRASYDGSVAQALVGRSIWYMEYGFMKYGHTKYASTGYIDCSNFASLVYKDFGYSITSAAKNYGSVGVKVDGVYGQKISGSSKYTLVGVDKLKPGDIFTFWNSDKTQIGHVAIYMGVINGKPCIINTCDGNPTAIGIIHDFSYWYGSSLKEVRRVLPDSAYVPGTQINASGPVIPAQYQIKPDQPIIMPKNLAAGF